MMTLRFFALSRIACLLLAAAFHAPLHADQWRMGGRDPTHTHRTDFVVPPARQNSSFFDWVLRQTPTPGSPAEGNLSATTMVFFDGAGPAGADVVIGGYHWPKGVQAMDRRSGERFWFGLPAGGEAIATRAPAFSSDGSVVYVTNDASAHPLMAFSTIIGPSSFWHNGDTAVPDHLSAHSPTLAADGRIFRKQWNDRPYAGSDLGTQITEVYCSTRYADRHRACPDAALGASVGLRSLAKSENSQGRAAMNGLTLSRSATGRSRSSRSSSSKRRASSCMAS
jgi:hypothetical protein